ncbi:hypothetical protein ILUMI_04503 [Ignelater luminosus]|uniref:Uncharacterized protein n=1 Tax=Ignelater luminosus TaxID=2038154 RepID=A0A8K0DJN6_IGNLU|nr:hypothetical protein ILUMI_04503 [Ignelater luminosus]
MGKLLPILFCFTLLLFLVDSNKITKLLKKLILVSHSDTTKKGHGKEKAIAFVLRVSGSKALCIGQEGSRKEGGSWLYCTDNNINEEMNNKHRKNIQYISSRKSNVLKSNLKEEVDKEVEDLVNESK